MRTARIVAITLAFAIGAKAQTKAIATTRQRRSIVLKDCTRDSVMTFSSTRQRAGWPGNAVHCGKTWSGRRESNPRMQLGKLPFYH
jgi:hypothetical protein